MKTQAQMKATKKWDAANLDRIEVQVKKGTKAEWKEYCKRLEMSMAQLVDTAVQEYVKDKV